MVCDGFGARWCVGVSERLRKIMYKRWSKREKERREEVTENIWIEIEDTWDGDYLGASYC